MTAYQPVVGSEGCRRDNGDGIWTYLDPSDVDGNGIPNEQDTVYLAFDLFIWEVEPWETFWYGYWVGTF